MVIISIYKAIEKNLTLALLNSKMPPILTMKMYVTGHIWFQVNFDLTEVESQFPFFPSPNLRMVRARRQGKLRMNLSYIKINLKSKLTLHVHRYM